MLPQLPTAQLLATKVARAKNARTAPRPTGNAAVGGFDPGIGQYVIAVWAALGVGFAHYARSKQYRNKPAPTAKKSKKRAKNRGPIMAARRNQNLMAFPSEESITQTLG
jgi:hypothetical protein